MIPWCLHVHAGAFVESTVANTEEVLGAYHAVCIITVAILCSSRRNILRSFKPLWNMSLPRLEYEQTYCIV